MQLVYVTHYAEVTFLNNNHLKSQPKHTYRIPPLTVNNMNRQNLKLAFFIFLKLVTSFELVLELDEAQKQKKMKPDHNRLQKLSRRREKPIQNVDFNLFYQNYFTPLLFTNVFLAISETDAHFKQWHATFSEAVSKYEDLTLNFAYLHVYKQKIKERCINIF